MTSQPGLLCKAATRLWVGLLNRSARATFHTGFRPGRWQTPRPIAPGDIVHLHSLTGWLGFGALEAIIPQGARIFWTAHDLWPLSGGCVVHNGCDRYTHGCRSCPLLSSPIKWLSRLEFNRKRRFIRRLHITPIANSRWTADHIRSSLLFPPFSQSHAVTLPRCDAPAGVPVVPPIVDDAFFEAPSLPALRTQLHLPPDRRVLGLGARALTDQAKGIPEFLQHLARHPSLKSSVTVLLAGGGTIPVGRVSSPGAQKDSIQNDKCLFMSQPGSADWQSAVSPIGNRRGSGTSDALYNPVGLDCRFLGPLTDPHQLARFYHACDVFISPSRMETFGMMLLEAQASGTPVLAFSTGGTAEAVCPQAADGLVARDDFPGLLSKLSSLLAEKSTLHERGVRAALWVKQNFSADAIAQRQQAIYEGILR
jgi:glycosyltransferase involved in cell wall biosynthesis